MSVTKLVTKNVVGVVGNAKSSTKVVMLGGVAFKLLWLKAKVSPKPPRVIFCIFTVVRVLVNTQLMVAPNRTLTAGIVMVLPEKLPKLSGLPVMARLLSVQVKPVSL